MTTSKYQVDDPQHRSISVTAGVQHVPFILEASDFDETQRRIDTEDGRLAGQVILMQALHDEYDAVCFLLLSRLSSVFSNH